MNRKYTTIIIDDEPLAREVIKKHLENFPDIQLLQECSNGFEGIKAIQEQHPDLVFLDIQMPKLTGFEMLELLEDPPIIIFITAYDQYALKAFEVSAVDYLLKPFSAERFREAVEKALLFMRDKPAFASELTQLVQQQTPQTGYLARIVVKESSKIMVIPVEKLIRIEALDDYVMLHTKEGRFLKQKTMKHFEIYLPPDEFIRIHRSHIVKLSAIKQIDLVGKDSHEVRLTGGESLPVSKSGYQRLKQMIN
jgi:two-component system LytT family response regulator